MFAYQQAGRYQDEDEANSVHTDIVHLLNHEGVDVRYLPAGTMQYRIGLINEWYEFDKNC